MSEQTWGEALAPEVEAWGLPPEQMSELLWEATAFPMAPPEYVLGQLAELRRLSEGNFVGAMVLARAMFEVDCMLHLKPLLPRATP